MMYATDPLLCTIDYPEYIERSLGLQEKLLNVCCTFLDQFDGDK